MINEKWEDEGEISERFGGSSSVVGATWKSLVPDIKLHLLCKVPFLSVPLMSFPCGVTRLSLRSDHWCISLKQGFAFGYALAQAIRYASPFHVQLQKFLWMTIDDRNGDIMEDTVQDLLHTYKLTRHIPGNGRQIAKYKLTIWFMDMLACLQLETRHIVAESPHHVSSSAGGVANQRSTPWTCPGRRHRVLRELLWVCSSWQCCRWESNRGGMASIGKMQPKSQRRQRYHVH